MNKTSEWGKKVINKALEYPFFYQPDNDKNH